MINYGCWWTRSESDPRWNMDGRCAVGGFQMPHECRAAIDLKMVNLGEEPPKDLTYEYMKD
jgi:hypothetical protein